MSDWWAARLGGGPPPASPSRPASPPAPTPWVPPVAAQATATAVATAPPPGSVTVGNLWDAVQHWRGGEAQYNHATCPGCGGSNLFRRKVGAVEAAPLCYDCGWNGIWTQVQPRG